MFLIDKALEKSIRKIKVALSPKTKLGMSKEKFYIMYMTYIIKLLVLFRRQLANIIV